jgi:hypothetical protein
MQSQAVAGVREACGTHLCTQKSTATHRRSRFSSACDSPSMAARRRQVPGPHQELFLTPSYDARRQPVVGPSLSRPPFSPTLVIDLKCKRRLTCRQALSQPPKFPTASRTSKRNANLCLSIMLAQSTRKLRYLSKMEH